MNFFTFGCFKRSKKKGEEVTDGDDEDKRDECSMKAWRLVTKKQRCWAKGCERGCEGLISSIAISEQGLRGAVIGRSK